MSFAYATAPTSAAPATPEKEQIYLNARLCERFGVKYNNEGEHTTIHTNALDKAPENWDEAHQAIIDRGGELRLKGTGYGWWEIVG